MKSLLLGVTFISGLAAAGNIIKKSQCTTDNVLFAVTQHSDCKSFMAMTIARTVVTATITSTVTRFNNNKFNPTTTSSTSSSMKSLTHDKSGLYTITPTEVPDYITSAACDSSCSNEQTVLSKYSSACSCAFMSPSPISAETATVTSVELLPTTVSDFKLRAKFPNGTYNYLAAETTDGRSWFGRTFLTFAQDAKKAALFAFTPDSRLRLESEGKLSILSGSLDYVKTLSFVPSTEDPMFRNPSFHITADMQKKSNTTEFSLSTSPMSPKSTDYSLPSAANYTVITACPWGICFGTFEWKAREFSGSGAKTSNDGLYQLIDLEAVPTF